MRFASASVQATYLVEGLHRCRPCCSCCRQRTSVSSLAQVPPPAVVKAGKEQNVRSSILHTFDLSCRSDSLLSIMGLTPAHQIQGFIQDAPRRGADPPSRANTIFPRAHRVSVSFKELIGTSPRKRPAASSAGRSKPGPDAGAGRRSLSSLKAKARKSPSPRRPPKAASARIEYLNHHFGTLGPLLGALLGNRVLGLIEAFPGLMAEGCDFANPTQSSGGISTACGHTSGAWSWPLPAWRASASQGTHGRGADTSRL